MPIAARIGSMVGLGSFFELAVLLCSRKRYILEKEGINIPLDEVRVYGQTGSNHVE